MKILILGGYGVFGGRLAELLADLPGLDLLICGRDLARAEGFCAAYRGAARVHPCALDRRAIAEGLERLQPDLVVDASGPFQDYGAERYHVVEACIAAGVDYLDFADGADFVSGIDRFDDRSRAAGLFVLSGVSSFPALTGAVLREMAKTMDIRSIEGGIAPSPFAGIGLNVMRAVVGYAGAPVKLRRGGRADGQPVERSWHLLAEGDDGPYIPSMAIEAIVRKLIAGERPAPGARSSVDALTLADYAALFDGRSIHMGFRSEARAAPLYRQILGDAFDMLPPALRALHGSTAERRWHGHAEVRRGTGLLARLAAAIVGFPKAAARVPVSVAFNPEKDGERWTRDFGGRRFSSLQSRGTGRNDYLLVERFGPLCFAMALVAEGGRLYLVPRRWSAFGVPMPRFLMPYGTSFEQEVDGKFRFDVDISMPLVGLIVGYRGALEPA